MIVRWKAISFTALFASSLGVAALAATAPAASPSVKWEGTLPAVGRDPSLWIDTIHDMEAHGMVFGAMAAANHMIAFFPDVNSKEASYKAVISIIDDGYPLLVRDIFIPGDLEPDPEPVPKPTSSRTVTTSINRC